MQDIFTEIGKDRHTIQITVDILNIGNLINSNWGVLKELNTGSTYNYGLLKTVSVTPDGVPTFQMTTVTQPDGTTVLPTTPFRDYFSVSNTWRMQLGLRYSF
jgi:hypothetical protein